MSNKQLNFHTALPERLTEHYEKRVYAWAFGYKRTRG